MISSTKRRLASLATASAIVATMAVAVVPGATLPATGDTVYVKGVPLTVMHLNPTAPITGDIDASAFDIGVYYGPGHSGTVTADISGAKYYGVVADGAAVNVTGSKVHHIGENPHNGMQYGNAIFYYNGASGTISGNQVYDFQKNGITISGKAADYVASGPKTSATVQKNVVTGDGPIDTIAQNGIQISYGASATVKNNTISGFDYTKAENEACGLLLYEAGSVTASGNRITDTETPIYGDATKGGHVKP